MSISELKPVVRLSVVNPNADSESEFGRGVANLCLGVREYGSLNAAAKNMGMAYSKAWRIMKETEASFGFQILDRDGAHGSTLTEDGNLLLDSFLKVSEELQETAEKAYGKFFD